MRNDIGFKVDAGFEEGDENGNLVYTGGGADTPGRGRKGQGEHEVHKETWDKRREGKRGERRKGGPRG